MSTPTLTYAFSADNQKVGSNSPNIIKFTLTLDGIPLAGQEIIVNLPAPLLYQHNLTTDANGQCYINITSNAAGSFPGVAVMALDPQVATSFLTTFVVQYPVVVRDWIVYVPGSMYKALSVLIGALPLTFDHIYLVTLSRKTNSIYDCNASRANIQLNPNGASECSTRFPQSLTDLSGDGLMFRPTISGNGETLYGRYAYRFELAGYTEVIVEDFGPSPIIEPAYAAASPLLLTQADDDGECLDCHG